jgi:uncharacterized SAM-binding protein YcdF (DUF218 family)
MIILPTIFALALLGAFALRGRRKMGAVVLALIICFLASWPPAGWVALRTLEWRYSPQMPPAQKPTDAIVVLGGYLQRNDWGGAPTNTGRRCRSSSLVGAPWARSTRLLRK